MKKIFFILPLIFIFLLISINADELHCSGTPQGCSNDLSQTTCLERGCNWNKKCTGNPNPCSHYVADSPPYQSCLAHGCNGPINETIENNIIISDGGETSSIISIFPRGRLGGDSINQIIFPLKVEVHYNGNPSNYVKISAHSPLFGDVHLKPTKDGIYSTNITIFKNVSFGTYRITYKAKYWEEYTETSFLINTEPGLYIITKNFVPKYYKGDYMNLSGFIVDKNKNIQKNVYVSASAYNENNLLFSIPDKTNEEGEFSIIYPINYGDPEGKWDISIEAISNENIFGNAKLSTNIDLPAGVNYYSVNFLSPLKETTLKRGDIIPISVEVSDFQGPVDADSVEVYTPSDKITLNKISKGIYSGEYFIKPDDIINDWLLKAEATKKIDNITKVGGASLPVRVESAKINFLILSPVSDIIYPPSYLKLGD